MSSIFIKSQTELDRVNSLLDKKIPSYRKAYSDRTAWIMAYLSELAYIRFNPSILTGKRTEFIQSNILNTLKGKRKTVFLLKWMESLDYDHNKEKEKLKAELQNLKMDIIETFDCNGTQAILVSYDDSIVLAFRGTEATSIEDIRADMKAKTTQCETGGRIHSGFKEAFEEAALDIQKKLNEDALQNKPLFITGHSLGGALATIAAKKLSHKGGIAACYTFGSPKVGDEEWIVGIKTPVYRVVNGVDFITMLPIGDNIITVFAWLSRCIVAWSSVPYASQLAKLFERWLLSNNEGYIHGGDMRYMTNCSNGQYNDVKLLYSVNIIRMIKGWKVTQFSWKKFLSDHSISIYRKKLMIIVEKQNPGKLNALLAK